VNELFTLSYADRRALVHWFEAVRRSPGRIAIWAIYTLGIGIWVAVHLIPDAHVAPLGPFTAASRDAWICGIAIAFGIALAGSAPWLGAFSSRAEGLIAVRADAPPALIVTYLQLRAMIVTVARGVAQYAYLILFALPSAQSAGALAAELAFFAASGAALASVPLPRALARGGTRIALTVAGVAVVVTAAIPLVLDALRALRLPETAAVLARVPEIHPGLVIEALAAGDMRALAIPLAIAACATVAFAAVSRDAFPELYAISVASLERRARREHPARAAMPIGSAERPSTARQGVNATRLRGALAFFWIDTLMFRRRVSPVVRSGFVAAGLAGGAILWVIAHRHLDSAWFYLITAVPGFSIAAAMTTSVQLAPAARMPLFWLGGTPLAARLAAWSFGGLWRDVVLVAAVACGYGLAGGEWSAPASLVVGAAGFLALSRAIGLAVFAMLPDPLDQFGPAALVRVLYFAMLLAPPAITVALALAFSAPVPLAAVAATAVALTESAVLIHVAATHLARGVDRLPG